MIQRLLPFFVVFCFSKSLFASDSTRVLPRFYFSWGYNRASFTKTDLHVFGPDYDFRLYDVRGHDRPTPFGLKNYFHPTHISIPQYNWRFGWNVTSRWTVSIGVDHLKYVMDADQVARLSGVVSEAASAKWAGSYLDENVVVSPDLLRFEHTDGLNLLNLDVEHATKDLWARGGFSVVLCAGAGGALVVPRSDVRVFGKGLNNRFHLAGCSFSGKTGLELRLPGHFFLRAQARLGWVFLPDVLVSNDEPQRIEHNLGFLERFVVAGKYF